MPQIQKPPRTKQIFLELLVGLISSIIIAFIKDLIDIFHTTCINIDDKIYFSDGHSNLKYLINSTMPDKAKAHDPKVQRTNLGGKVREQSYLPLYIDLIMGMHVAVNINTWIVLNFFFVHFFSYST